MQELGFIDAIKQKWESLKDFFKWIFDYLSPIIDKISAPLSSLWEGTKNISSKIGNFFGNGRKSEVTKSKTLNLQGLRKSVARPEVTRNQNNNFTINIQAAKNDNAESLANKVMNRVSDCGR